MVYYNLKNKKSKKKLKQNGLFKTITKISDQLDRFAKERKKRYKVSVPRMNEDYPYRTHKQAENKGILWKTLI